jgi:hypothetical protein
MMGAERAAAAAGLAIPDLSRCVLTRPCVSSCQVGATDRGNPPPLPARPGGPPARRGAVTVSAPAVTPGRCIRKFLGRNIRLGRLRRRPCSAAAYLHFEIQYLTKIQYLTTINLFCRRPTRIFRPSTSRVSGDDSTVEHAPGQQRDCMCRSESITTRRAGIYWIFVGRAGSEYSCYWIFVNTCTRGPESKRAAGNLRTLDLRCRHGPTGPGRRDRLRLL